MRFDLAPGADLRAALRALAAAPAPADTVQQVTEAFVRRRSMPWTDGQHAGLQFVAFGHTVDNFERLLRHMVRADDGTVDALFGITRPVTGAYAWCPPLADDRLDLRAVGL